MMLDNAVSKTNYLHIKPHVHKASGTYTAILIQNCQ